MSIIVITPSDDFHAAIASLHPGDTLYLRAGGTYPGVNGNQVVFPSGNSWADAPVIASYPGEVATVHWIGFGAPTDLGQTEMRYLVVNGIKFTGRGDSDDTVGFWGNAHHIRIQNCDISGASSNRNGIGMQPNNSNVAARFIEILDTKVHHNGSGSGSGQVGHGIYGACTDSLFRGLTVYENGDYGLQFYSEFISPDRNTLEKSRFYENGQGSNVTGGAVTIRGVSNKCFNLITHDHRGAGIAARGDNHQIYNCTVHKCGSDGYPGIYITGGTAQVKNNISCLSNGISGGTQDHNLVTDDPSIFVSPT